MTVFLNGQFLPESEAKISVFDRSFLLGDGLFETIRVANEKPFRWTQHMARLSRGAEFLGIPLPFTPEAMAGFAADLVARNQLPEALLRLTLSRGVGVRGYSPKGADKPTLVMTLHPVAGAMEPGVLLRWRAHTTRFRLPAGDALAPFKTNNKLVQVLARAEAEAAGADEALLVNTDGFVAEAASGNLFWISGGSVNTPPLASGVLAGITRDVVSELCAAMRVPVREADVRPEQLTKAEGAFLSLSSFGIVELAHVGNTSLPASPLTRRLASAYAELLRRETQ